VTNQLWFISSAALGEGFATGLAHGVELGTLWHAIQHSVVDSFVVRHDAPSIFAGHYDPSISLDLCFKDLALIRHGRNAAELHVGKRIEDDSGLSMRLAGNWVPPWEQ
jgi:3-hydroxyisobutyrate dehydrogenase